MKLHESNFKFSNPYLKKMDFEINKDFNKDEYEGDMNPKAKLLVRKSKDSDKNIAWVFLNITLGEKTKEYPFFLECEMFSDFHWTKDIDNSIDQYLELNAPSLLLSYMRPIISNITGSSGFAPFHMPFIDFSRRTLEKDYEEDSED